MVKRVLDESDRRALLRELCKLQSDADVEREAIMRVFLPLPEHHKALDDRIVLVLGTRGAGKSALFHFLQKPEAWGFFGQGRQEGAGARRWLVGFSETGIDHASPMVLEGLAQEPEGSEERMRRFWLGHLVGRLADAEKDLSSLPFLTPWRAAPADPSRWLAGIGEVSELVSWLDQLEKRLAAERRTLVVTYDHLDKTAVRSRDLRRRIVSPLLALWLSLSNRYRQIRAKIFLRRDLFDEAVSGTADVSKLLARAETLRWSVSSLYRLLIRHFAQHEGLRAWVSAGTWKIRLTEDPQLGWMPPEDFPEEAQRKFMAHVVGERMGQGSDPRSGYSWIWVPKHVEDAHGVIAPRSMITLFESAASSALSATPKGQFTRLLAPEEFKEGLRETSRRRVVEMEEEHPVITRLKFLQDTSLPAQLSEVVRVLSSVSDEVGDDFGSSGERVLDELTRLGAIVRLPKDKIDIPDIYRLRFKISRRGPQVTPVEVRSG